MSERFTTIFRLPESLVLNGCPAAIEAGALLKDNSNNRKLCQLKIISLSDQIIKAVKVRILCKDPMGVPVQGPEDYQYSDLSVSCGQSFGVQSPIFVPDGNTSFFTPVIIGVALSDGTVWKNDAVQPMTPLPAPVGLETMFPSNDLIGQYRRETNSNALYVPVQCQNIWRCTCGRINSGVACSSCGIEKSKLLQVTDINYISNALDERVAAERAAEEERIAKKRAEAEEKARIQKEQEDAAFASAVAVLESSNQIAELEAAKKKYDSLAETRDTSKKEVYETKIKTLKKRKRRKRNLCIGAVVLLIGLGLFGYYVGYPFFLRKTAESAVANHNYDAAIANYMKLKDDTKITETNYEKANYLLEQKQFDDAAAVFESLGDYKDSSNMKRQSGYLKGKDLIENKKYHEAIAAFKGLENYEDTGKLIAQAKYEQALLDIGSGEYKEAADFLNDAKNYVDDAKTKLPEVQYVYGKELMGNGKFEDALKYLNPLKTSDTFEDIKQLVDECNYKAGLACITARDYPTAIRHFEQVKDTASYPELSSKINEAKYLYVSSHKKDSDSTTYNYLKDLRQIGYKDSSTIYSSLYAWRAERVVANTSENNTSTDSSSISKYSSIYFHFNLAGGPPNGKVNTLSSSVTFSDGSKTLYSSWTDAYPASNYWHQVWWENPSYANNVNATFYLYADGVLIAQKTVYWGS